MIFRRTQFTDTPMDKAPVQVLFVSLLQLRLSFELSLSLSPMLYDSLPRVNEYPLVLTQIYDLSISKVVIFFSDFVVVP